jgi:hypothetical protein
MPTPTAIETLNTVAGGNLGLLIQGSDAQTVDLLQCQDSAHNLLLRIGQSGAFSGSMDTVTYSTPTSTVHVMKGTLHQLTATGMMPTSVTVSADLPGNAAQEMTLLLINGTNDYFTFNFDGTFRVPASQSVRLASQQAALLRFVSDSHIWYQVAATIGV